MIDGSATARVERLVRWLEQFKRCFGHRAQLLGLRTYVQGVFSDSDRKSMQAMRARVTAVRGRDVNLESYADVRGRGSLAREYVITYRSQLEENEQLAEGTFWAGEPALPSDGPQEVSIEFGIHERYDINVGDTMRFDVLGRTIEATAAIISITAESCAHSATSSAPPRRARILSRAERPARPAAMIPKVRTSFVGGSL